MNNSTLPQPPYLDQESNTTIRRGKHDRENPYVMISKNMIRDNSLSLRNRGALLYLLSLPDDWQAHPRHLAKAMDISRNQIYSILKDLIEAGYATKETVKDEKGRFATVTYFFYEEKLACKRGIQKQSTLSQNPYPENPYLAKGTLLKKDSLKEERSLENITSLKVSDPPDKNEEIEKQPAVAVSAKADEKRVKKLVTEVSKEAKELGDVMIEATIEAIKGTKFTYLPPKNRSALYTSLDEMIRIDGRTPQFILDVFKWALSDSFWLDKLLKPNIGKYLRAENRIDQLNAKMNQSPPKKERKFAPCSDDKEAFETIKRMTKL